MNPHTMLVRLFYNSHSFINRIRDRIVDKKLGIQTYRLDLEINDRNIYYGYAPTPYQSLKILFAHFPFDDKDVFVDFGCGRGRVAIYASIYGCKKVYGIDINDYMIEKANGNLLQLKKETTNINFIKQDALQFEITPDINKFYFFNPFHLRVIIKIMNKINQSVADYPRKVYIFVYFPSDQWKEWFDKMSKCRLLKRVQVLRTIAYYIYTV